MVILGVPQINIRAAGAHREIGQKLVVFSAKTGFFSFVGAKLEFWPSGNRRLFSAGAKLCFFPSFFLSL